MTPMLLLFRSLKMRAGARIAAGVALLALAACVRAAVRSDDHHNPWTTPGVLRYAVSSDPTTLNPALYPFEPTLDVSTLVFSWAIRYDERARPVPDALR